MKARDSISHHRPNTTHPSATTGHPPATARKKTLPADETAKNPRLTRRRFFQRARNLTAAATAGALAPAVAQRSSSLSPSTVFQDGLEGRRLQAFEVRQQAALQQSEIDPGPHRDNGDEGRYSNRIGNFSKGLPHNARGEVDISAYQSLLDALASPDPSLFESIPMGAGNSLRQIKLVNPQASLAFDMEGRDSHQFLLPPAPELSSAEAAAEAVELYWQAAMRDIPFAHYTYAPYALAASTELSKLNAFRGPRYGGKRVTPATLFRGFTPGDLAGPYISQFLLKGAPLGAQYVEQRMRCLRPGADFMTDFKEWLSIQNGSEPRRKGEFEAQRRYIQTGRDLAQWVHIDVLYQAYFNAALILGASPEPGDTATGGGMGAPMNPGNPYLGSRTQAGFGTFGGPHIMALVAEVSTRALKAVWFQKWQVHRRLRPEAYGGLVHLTKTDVADYPIAEDVLSSVALAETYRRYGTYLLPQAFPEGSPLHPAYGAGHATVAGACVTVLKAFFDESFVIPNPVVPSLDGQSLVSYRAPDEAELTVGGELNKLAANVSIGRNFAGIHWRSDYTESLKLGEAVAISVLEDHRLTYNEPFEGFRFTKFDGTVYEV